MATCRGAVPGAGTRPPAAGGGAPAFPAAQPLVLDLGCGNGVFLSALAAVQPGWNILGIERKEYRVRQARRRTAEQPNARVVHGEAAEILRGLPEASVACAYLLFSDPWPKRRHAARRLVQPGFLGLLATRLAAGGTLFFATDARDYARATRTLLADGGWGVGDWTVAPGWPRTEFESRFLARGLPVWRLLASRPAMP